MERPQRHAYLPSSFLPVRCRKIPAPTKSTITPPAISVPTGGLESAFSERVCCAEESWARSDASTASSAGNAGARLSSASTPESSGATGPADSAPSVDPSEAGDESSFSPAPDVAESLGLGDVVLADRSEEHTSELQ